MSDADSSAVDLADDRPRAFFQRVESTNPFLDNRINGPSVHDVDVDAIHQAAFARLTGLARQACDSGRGVGAVLWGEAGIGKSHLLSRLGRWAEGDNRACFAYLHNLQAAPEYLPRSLLQGVVSILTQGRNRQLVGTPLFELVRGSLLEAVNHDFGHYTWGQLSGAYTCFVERLAQRDLAGAALIDRTVYEVLFRFFRSAWRACQCKEDGTEAALAVRWLSGQTLDPDEARALGLPPARRAGEPVALLDNQQIKQVLVTLTRLAASRQRPFLLVFDQVDNLDEDQAAALARFLEAVIDSSPNLLVVTAGVKDTLVRWVEQQVIQKSAWDRLAQIEVALQRVKPAEALRIIEARLQSFLIPFADIEDVQKRRADDALFPLGTAWRDRFFRDRIEVRPRDAVNWASEGWRRQQEALGRKGGPDWLKDWPEVGADREGPPVELNAEEVRQRVDRAVEERLTASVAELREHPERLPPDANHLAGLVHTLLVQCRDAGRPYGVWEVEHLTPLRSGPRRTYDLSIRQGSTPGTEVQTGVLFVTEGSPVSVAAYLRRLSEDPRPLDRVLLVTEERIGLPLGGRGQEYLDELEERGPHRFQRLNLSLPEYAELEALQQLVGLARSGDLEIELAPGQARAVSEREVIDSYHRRGRYLASRLLRAVLDGTDEAVVAPAPQALAR